MAHRPRTLHLHQPKGGVKKLVDYLLTADKGQKDVLAVGYVPLQH